MSETPDQTPHVDPHHRVPDEQWGEVVRNAKVFRTESDESETE